MSGDVPWNRLLFHGPDMGHIKIPIFQHHARFGSRCNALYTLLARPSSEWRSLKLPALLPDADRVELASLGRRYFLSNIETSNRQFALRWILPSVSFTSVDLTAFGEFHPCCSHLVLSPNPVGYLVGTVRSSQSRLHSRCYPG